MAEAATAPKEPRGEGVPDPSELMPEEVAFRSQRGVIGAAVVIATIAMMVVVLNQILNLGFFARQFLHSSKW